jgi:hypothetical protein
MFVNQHHAIKEQSLIGGARRRIGVALVLLLIVILIVGFFGRLYILRDDNGGEILWNAKGAFLFMDEARRGYRIRYLVYPWILVKEVLHAPPFPNDQQRSLTVIHVTSAGVERHTLEVSGNVPDLLTPVGESIYANCEGTLCKWSGQDFEMATPEEQRKVGGIVNLSPLGFDNRNGWSKRRVGATESGGSFSIAVGGGSIFVKQGNRIKTSYDTVFIQLLRPGQKSEQLWHVDGSPHLVGKQEYRRVFR